MEVSFSNLNKHVRVGSTLYRNSEKYFKMLRKLNLSNNNVTVMKSNQENQRKHESVIHHIVILQHTHRKGKDVFSRITCCVTTQLLQGNSFKIKASCLAVCVRGCDSLVSSSAAALTEEERAHTYTEEDHLYKQDSVSRFDVACLGRQ